MTAPTITEIATVEGRPPIRVVEMGQQESQTEPVESTSSYVEYGGAYSPADEEPELRLNLPASGLARLLDEQQGRLTSAQRELESAIARVANEVGDPSLAETWDTVKSDKPKLYESVVAAERYATKLTSIVRMNAEAVERETNAAPLSLGDRDAERAATTLPLLTVQVERGSLTEIRDTLRVAIANQDDATCYVLAILLPDRLRRAAQTRDDGDGMRVMRDGDPRLRSEIEAMIASVRTRLRDESLSALHRRAQGLKIGAGKIASDAGRRRRALEFSKSGLVRREL